MKCKMNVLLMSLALSIAGCGTMAKTESVSVESPAMDNALSSVENAAGWELLFDGKTTKGWRNFKSKTIRKGWSVQSGALVHTKGGGDIVTVKQFANFEFVLDWKIGKDTNSGIMYRVSEDLGAPYLTGAEYQILDNNSTKYGDAKKDKNIAGSNYALYESDRSAVKPLGQWNHTKIVANGNHIEHWLNGKKVVSYVINSAEWKNRIANSKFRDWKRFGLEKKGHINLQDHGDKVWFKNIKIREIK